MFAPFAEPVKRHNKDVHIAREECNKYDLTTAPCVSDWRIKIIGPGGLVLVVFHVFAVSVL